MYHFCRDPEMTAMQCMMMTGSSTLLMGGHQTSIFEFDLNTAKRTRKVSASDGVQTCHSYVANLSTIVYIA